MNFRLAQVVASVEAMDGESGDRWLILSQLLQTAGTRSIAKLPHGAEQRTKSSI